MGRERQLVDPAREPGHPVLELVPHRQDEGIQQVEERRVEGLRPLHDERGVWPGELPEGPLGADDEATHPAAMGTDIGVALDVPDVVERRQMLLDLFAEAGRALRDLQLHLGDPPDLVLGVEAGGPALADPRLDLLHQPGDVHRPRRLVGHPTVPPCRSAKRGASAPRRCP